MILSGVDLKVKIITFSLRSLKINKRMSVKLNSLKYSRLFAFKCLHCLIYIRDSIVKSKNSALQAGMYSYL